MVELLDVQARSTLKELIAHVQTSTAQSGTSEKTAEFMIESLTCPYTYTDTTSPTTF